MATQEAYLDFEGAPLLFDVVMTETLEHTATATEHPVEQGANVSDHVIDNLDMVSLDIFVSNSPVDDVNDMYGGSVSGLDLKVPTLDRPPALTPGSLMNAGIDAVKGLLNGPTAWKALVQQFPEKFDNVSFILSTLIDWKERGVLGKVITPHRSYESMVIVGVKSDRDSSTGDASKISLSLKEIRLVEAKLVTAPIPTEPRGAISKPKGRQPTSFVRDPAPKKSVFAKLLHG